MQYSKQPLLRNAKFVSKIKSICHSLIQWTLKRFLYLTFGDLPWVWCKKYKIRRQKFNLQIMQPLLSPNYYKPQFPFLSDEAYRIICNIYILLLFACSNKENQITRLVIIVYKYEVIRPEDFSWQCRNLIHWFGISFFSLSRPCLLSFWLLAVLLLHIVVLFSSSKCMFISNSLLLLILSLGNAASS